MNHTSWYKLSSPTKFISTNQIPLSDSFKYYFKGSVKLHIYHSAAWPHSPYESDQSFFFFFFFDR